MTTVRAHVGNEEHVFTFEKTEEGAPIKLGDGTFGAVFKVRNAAGIPFAIKLFYDTKDPTLLARQALECKSRQYVVDAIPRGKESLLSNLLLSEAYSDSFLTSDASRSFAKWFENAGLSVSTNAVITPLYDCTLKEILEHGAPVGRLIGQTVATERGMRGYDLLRSLNVEAREAVILPFVQQVASGLRALHAGKLCHHDLKPANILVRNSGGRLDVALADFGFLLPSMAAETMASRFGEGLPLGTRHYRSPEQKDFFDICEVDVQIIDAGNTSMKLVTVDAKFADTIIEKGDVVVFAKDPGRLPFQIESIQTDAGKTTAIVKPMRDQKVLADVRTQCIFYKIHTARTDLFGLGALLFDLVTCGESPERFYDYLRPYDRPERAQQIPETNTAPNKAEGRVSNLLSHYSAFREGLGLAAGYSTLFEKFQSSDFSCTTSEMVQIILKCMMSRPRESYFVSGDALRSPAHAFELVWKDLQQAMDDRNGGRYTGDRNPIWSDTKQVTKDPTPSSKISSLLRGVRDDSRPLLQRLGIAYRVISKLFNFCGVARQNYFFCDVSPDNLLYAEHSRDFRVQSVRYSKETQYLSAIKEGDALGLTGNLERDSFVPPCLRFMARSTEVKILDTGADATENAAQIFNMQIYFKDSLPMWEPLATGDLIRVDSADRQTVLLEITGAKDGETGAIQTRIKRGEKFDSANDLERCIAIKRLNPIRYYLSMIGIYLHHLVFADSRKDTGSIPSTIWLLEQARSLGFALPKAKKCPVLKYEAFTKLEKSAQIESIQNHIAELYLWLVAYNPSTHPGFNCDDNDGAATLFGEVKISLENLRDAVALTLGITSGVLDESSDEDFSKRQFELQPPSLNGLNDRLRAILQHQKGTDGFWDRVTRMFSAKQ